MRLVVLDGADSIGGNKVYLESGDAGLLLDFGINYQRLGMYYEEYLKPRAGRGLLDLYSFGLIPSIGDLYREDLYPEDFQPSYERHLNVAGLFISHAHLDHCGLIGVLREDLPVYASPVGISIMKSMQDSGSLDFYSEMAYYTKRSGEDDPRVLSSGGWQKNPFRSRRVYITSEREGPPEFHEFWCRPPNPRGKKLEAQELGIGDGQIGGIRYRFFPIDHSIPGAQAYAFETDSGWVVYTGDLRLHGKDEALTRAFTATARDLKPSVLIIEGTRLRREEQGNPTEEDVYRNSLDIVKGADGKLVVADFAPRNLERLETFLRVAQESGRTLLVLTKDAYLLDAVRCADTSLDFLSNPKLGIFDDIRLETRAWDRGIRERYSDRLVEAGGVKRQPGEFILAFSFWDVKNLLDIGVKGGVYIYSSSEAFEEQQEIDMWRLWNWLSYFDMEVHGLYVGEDRKPLFQGDLHASGHASADELIELAKEVQPKYLVPIHTESAGFFQEALRGEPIEVRIMRNGEGQEF